MKHSDHYNDILDWVKSFVKDQGEAEGLANQVHYLSIKERRKAIAIGVVAGWITMGLLIAWIS